MKLNIFFLCWLDAFPSFLIEEIFIFLLRCRPLKFYFTFHLLWGVEWTFLPAPAKLLEGEREREDGKFSGGVHLEVLWCCEIWWKTRRARSLLLEWERSSTTTTQQQSRSEKAGWIHSAQLERKLIFFLCCWKSEERRFSTEKRKLFNSSRSLDVCSNVQTTRRGEVKLFRNHEMNEWISVTNF